MKLAQRFAFPVMIITILGLAHALPARAQGSTWDSSSRKGKPKSSAPMMAKEVAPIPAAPASAVPIVNPDEYIVGESDMLHISVWKEPELSQTVMVRPDGKVALPLIGEVKLSGMTPTQVQTMLSSRLKAYIVNPQVTVTVTDIRSKNAYITGEVARPGAYPLVKPTTVLQLIAQAGGLSIYAHRSGIFILRDVNGKSVRLPFPYKDVMKGKQEDQNLELRPGDTVVIP